MQKIWFDYAKTKYGNNTQVSIIVWTKAEHVSADIERNVENDER